jgi:hypothetical protein
MKKHAQQLHDQLQDANRTVDKLSNHRQGEGSFRSFVDVPTDRQ